MKRPGKTKDEMAERLTEREKARYERSIRVEGFGEEAQERLRAARVLVVGAGGLGSAVLQYLAAAGVGTLGIVECDTVSESNLQRQVLYTDADLNRPKVEAAARRVEALNPAAWVVTYPDRLTEENAAEILAGFDIVADCTDNYPTRYVIDRTAGRLRMPMVYGTAQDAGGQVSVFHAEGAGSYADLYPEPEPNRPERPIGVLSPVPGIVGSIQAMEVVKLATGFGRPLAGRLLVLDALAMECTVFDLPGGKE